MTPQKVIEADILAFARSELKISIWEDVKAGKIIQTNKEYEPDERITYWTANRDKYFNRIKDYIDMPDVIDIVLEVLSKLGIDILEPIRKLIKL